MLSRTETKKIFFNFKRLQTMGQAELIGKIQAADPATFDKALTTKIKNGDTLYHFLLKNKEPVVCEAMMQKASSAALSQAIQIEDAAKHNGFRLTSNVELLQRDGETIDSFVTMVNKTDVAAIDKVLRKQDKDKSSGLLLLAALKRPYKEQRVISVINKASQAGIDNSMNLTNIGGWSTYTLMLFSSGPTPDDYSMQFRRLFLALLRKASVKAKNSAFAQQNGGDCLSLMSSHLTNDQFNELITEANSDALSNALISTVPKVDRIDPSRRIIGWTAVAIDQNPATFQLILNKCFNSLKQVNDENIQATAAALRENKQCSEEDAPRFLEVTRHVKEPYESICKTPEGFFKFCKNYIPDTIAAGFDYSFWINFIENALIKPKKTALLSSPGQEIKNQLAMLLGKLHLAQQKGVDNSGKANSYFLSVSSPNGLPPQDCLQLGTMYKELSSRPFTPLSQQIDHYRNALLFYREAAKKNDAEALTVFGSEVYTLLKNSTTDISNLTWSDQLEQDYQQATSVLPSHLSDPQIVFMKYMTELRLYVAKRKSETWRCFGWLGYSEADARLRETLYKELKEDVDNYSLNTAEQRLELQKKLIGWLKDKRISGGRRQQCATIFKKMLYQLREMKHEVPISRPISMQRM